MTNKEKAPEPLEPLAVMTAFLNGNLPNRKINFGNSISVTQKEIEQACKAYNDKIIKTKDNNLE
jgi:hypothetical protein